jgi:uncharacterized membrane-anchored protein YitT (DUF2179 family)
MRDRPRQFYYFVIFALLAAFRLQLFNMYFESLVSMQFYSVPSQALGLIESVPAFSSFTFFPFILFSTLRRRHDIHLSLTSGWVHLA